MSVFVREYFQRADELAQAGEDFVVFTWTKSLGHAPQDLGAKAIVTRSGLQWGTIGGGKVEAKAIALGVAILSEPLHGKAPRLLQWDLQRDVGMSCGGSVEMMLEVFPARPWNIVIFGAGHVAQALVRSLALLDCHVSCLDTRQEWLDRLPARGPRFEPMLLSELGDYLDHIRPQSYCILVTKGHATDWPLLRRLVLRDDLSYLGVIGSTVKARKLRAELKAEGHTPEAIQRFQCPMGLGFKSHEPAEIAISIIAELLMRKNGPHPRLRDSDKAAL